MAARVEMQGYAGVPRNPPLLEGNELEDDDDSKSLPLGWLLPWMALGFCEGFLFQKVAVVYPAVLADQFVFRNWVVMKFFVSAVGFSMLSQAVLSTIDPETFSHSLDYGRTMYGSPRVVLGCSILGVGMAIAGSGPSMFMPAVAAGVGETGWLLAGGLGAALVVAVLDLWVPVTATGTPSTMLTVSGMLEHKADKKVGYAVLAGGMGLVMVMAAVGLEVLFPYKEDLAQYGGVFTQEYPADILKQPSWPPMLVGIAAGSAQLVVRQVSGDGLGTATSFTITVATLTWGKLAPGKGLQESRKNWWQPLFILCILGGSVVAGVSAPELDGARADDRLLEEGFEAWVMALGGFLCISGARIAGGCTCGHGVSGTSELSVESFAGAGAIFGAAIATKCLIEYV
mmetsp:Transcript_57091/g.131410  ORF Transcript_57091/g.131410 Transcript_57091/m.131410 type:complete len:399 (+) Transcript_57091:36-1232(+)